MAALLMRMSILPKRFIAAPDGTAPPGREYAGDTRKADALRPAGNDCSLPVQVIDVHTPPQILRMNAYPAAAALASSLAVEAPTGRLTALSSFETANCTGDFAPRRRGKTSAMAAVGARLVGARPLCRHQSQQRDRQDALPPEPAPDLERDTDNSWIKESGRCLRPRGAFKYGVVSGAPPRHPSCEHSDRRDRHKEAGDDKAGQDIVELQRHPVIQSDTEKGESRQRRKRDQRGPDEKRQSGAGSCLNEKNEIVLPILQHTICPNSFWKMAFGRRKQMIDHYQADDRNRHGQKGPDRAPHPGPKCQRQKYQKRIQRKTSTDDGGRNEVTFRRRQGHEGERRDERMAE